MDETARKLLPAVMAFFMSMCVAFVVTAKNLGFVSGFVTLWLQAWSLAFPIAATAAYLFMPVARRVAVLLAKGLQRLRGRVPSPTP